MAPKEVVRSCFAQPAARGRLAALGHHIELPTFNLATTSLRHTRKWLDRLKEIEAGEIKEQCNFFSDSGTLWLVHRGTKGVSLTPAGRAFLGLKDAIYDNSCRTEYELIKILYSGRFTLPSKVRTFLENKREHLLGFLSQCRPTPQRQLMFEDPRLLAIAEMLTGFEGALNIFFSLSETDLRHLANLGEGGFKTLFGEKEKPPGISRLCIKIGSDYTRAADRRRNMIFALTLLTLRQDLSRRGVRGARLEIPEPFCNLVGPSDLYEFHDRFTDDLTVAADQDGFVVVRRDTEDLPAPRIQTTTVEAMVRELRRGPVRLAGKGTVRRPTGQFFDLALAEGAERYLQDQVLKQKYARNHQRIGHPDLEMVRLD